MMLEVFYETDSRVVMAWRGDERMGIHELRDGESKVVLDIAPPSTKIENGATVRDYLYDETNQSLILNPDYVEPEPPMDLGAEIKELKAKVEILEKK